jgi:hypothetical protein
MNGWITHSVVSCSSPFPHSSTDWVLFHRTIKQEGEQRASAREARSRTYSTYFTNVPALLCMCVLLFLRAHLSRTNQPIQKDRHHGSRRRARRRRPHLLLRGERAPPRPPAAPQHNNLKSNKNPQHRPLHKVLGLSRGCSGEDIRRAYRRLAVMHHPGGSHTLRTVGYCLDGGHESPRSPFIYIYPSTQHCTFRQEPR